MLNEDTFKIGLTGGIASGKSTVANLFAALGVAIVDTDVIARDIVAPGEPALDQIRTAFGDTVLGDDGALNRAQLRQMIFADDGMRARLEKILHPRIRKVALQQAANASGPYVIIVVPLLYESPMKQAMDRVLVVDCSEETQLQRLTARDNESEDQARRIISTQASRSQRLSIADDVISSENPLADTEAAVRSLHESYLNLARREN